MAHDRERWFAAMMKAGLDQSLFGPADVLAHATPQVLAEHLPPELMSQVLAASLSAGAMTPDSVLDTVDPALLAKHVPHEILWACIAAAASRAGMTASKGK